MWAPNCSKSMKKDSQCTKLNELRDRELTLSEFASLPSLVPSLALSALHVPDYYSSAKELRHNIEYAPSYLEKYEMYIHFMVTIMNFDELYRR